ncbi:homoserine O-acetyltransferase MetX [Pontiella sulfatireligans]|uniref:Homoserine O-acetyltransferase n=1 Tax=Pontiella sulfatireligans TaxID=2750658 RepID=A0A6C2UL95_9BACT|nr:homoserine O-acetyltransferase [Pontiella sulfatireligans]VGO20739.1 Homoserine O-acetyltransferase [Pontiella sulfatireligans]
METRSKFYTYGEDEKSRLVLHDGRDFGPVTLAYEAYGKLNEAKDNAILIFHALSGSQHVAGFNPEVPNTGDRWNSECQTGWWDGFVGPGKTIDTDRFFIICVNYFGGCYGSTGPSSINPETGKKYGGDFPHFTFGDIVDSQIPLFNALGIERFHAAVGSSLGGMLVMNFASRYPERVNRIIPVACGLESTTLTRVHNLEQILAIENDPNFCNGHYYDGPRPLRGLALARMISHKTFVSLLDMEARMSDKCEQEHDEFSWYRIRTPLESYILHQGRKFLRRFDANTYLYLIAGWTNYNLARDFGTKDYAEVFKGCEHQEYLVFSIDSDCCFYPDEQEYLFQKLQENGIASEYITVHSEKGHDSFLLEPELYSEPIRNMLEKT